MDLKYFNKQLDELSLSLIYTIIKIQGYVDFTFLSSEYRLCNKEVKDGRMIKHRKWWQLKTRFKKKTIKDIRKEKLNKIENV